MNLNDNITVIKGVGTKVADAFLKLHIETVRDLVMFLPKRFDVFEETTDLTEDNIGKVIAIDGIITPGSHFALKKGRLNLNRFKIMTKSGSCMITFFNMPYIRKTLVDGKAVVVRGVLSYDKFGYHISQPNVYSPEKYSGLVGTLMPQYRTVKGISSQSVSKYVKIAIKECAFKEDFLSKDELERMGLVPYEDAISFIHNPSSIEDYYRGRRRLVFQEFLSFLLPVKLNKESERIKFTSMLIPVAETNRLIESLPYMLTNAQQKTWKEIESDMTSGYCMNRLIQGDVGSGKTIIAFLALLLNAANNHQGCLMAPTEVLATQHYENIKNFKNSYGEVIRPVLLTGAMKAADKREAYEGIKSGRYNVVIGTHALIQEKVEYNDLTLCITDEQHRFGVNQRIALAEKSKECHILVMSATPIPRTLAMIMYGDLDISVMNELPCNRLPIKNAVVDFRYRKKSYEFIEKEVMAGHQAYVICPMVEEGAAEELENVVAYTEKLREALPDSIRIDYIHGKMKANEKASIMSEFSRGNIDVLVSTTVIEVGINVPNATVMLVENADRFGLSGLHQLRGRVGRGDAQSYCIFISGSTSKKAKERLEVLAKYNDGFKIADEDLRLRGPGDIFGIRQSGDFNFTLADIYNDSEILIGCSNYVKEIMSDDSKRLNAILENMSDYEISSVDFRSI